MALKTLSEITEKAKQGDKKVLAVAVAQDKHVLEAVKASMAEGIVDVILVGDTAKISKIASEINFDLSELELVHEENDAKACVKAIEFIKIGKADILMKGLVSTAVLLKAVLDKEKGLRKSNVLSHVAVFETPHYHKLIGVTDAAMNVAPELNEKLHIVNNAVELFNRIGVETPKVAVLAAVELVNPKMQASVDAALLSTMNLRGQIKNCIVDGPLALDNAISKEAAEHKGIKSEVAGDADILVAHDINTGNVLYKSLNFMGGAVSAAVIMGAQAPIVLTSRADSEISKKLSIALAAAMD